MFSSHSVPSKRHILLLIVCVFVMVQSVYYLTRVPETKEHLPGDHILDFIPPFIPLLNDYAVSTGYNLLGCNIRKSMSQLTFNIMCYLNNTNAFIEHNQTMSDTWKIERDSCPKISWGHFNPLFESGALKMRDLTKFAFIRHPEERFASFYLDKCLRANLCENCTSIRCVSKLVYDRLSSIARNQSNYRKDDPQQWFEWHAAPQTWNCDFHENLLDFHLIPIGTAPEERKLAMRKLQKVLDFAGVPQVHIEKIVRDTETGDTAHSTYDSEQSDRVLKEIRDDPYIRHYLHHTYYHDYVAFGFNMTEILGNAVRQLEQPMVM